jgi:hypothetical protein
MKSKQGDMYFEDDGADVRRGLQMLTDDEPPFVANLTQSVDTAVRTVRRRRGTRLAVAMGGAVAIAGGVVGATQLLPGDVGGDDVNVATPADEGDEGRELTDDEAVSEPGVGEMPQGLENLAIKIADETGRDFRVTEVRPQARGVLVAVDIDGYGPAEIEASDGQPSSEEEALYCSPAVGNVCEELWLEYPNAAVDMDLESALEFQNVGYDATSAGESITIQIRNYVGEPDADTEAGPPVSELGLDQASFRRAISESDLMSDAEFPAPGPGSMAIEQLALDVAALADGDAAITSVDEPGYTNVLVTVPSGSFLLGVSAGNTSVAQQATSCEEDIDRVCAEVAAGEGWGAWARTYESSNQSGRTSLELTLDTDFGSLLVRVDNYAELPPNGTKAVGPPWDEVGLTPEAIVEIVESSGILDR